MNVHTIDCCTAVHYYMSNSDPSHSTINTYLVPGITVLYIDIYSVAGTLLPVLYSTVRRLMVVLL